MLYNLKEKDYKTIQVAKLIVSMKEELEKDLGSLFFIQDLKDELELSIKKSRGEYTLFENKKIYSYLSKKMFNKEIKDIRVVDRNKIVEIASAMIRLIPFKGSEYGREAIKRVEGYKSRLDVVYGEYFISTSMKKRIRGAWYNTDNKKGINNDTFLHLFLEEKTTSIRNIIAKSYDLTDDGKILKEMLENSHKVNVYFDEERLEKTYIINRLFNEYLIPDEPFNKQTLIDLVNSNKELKQRKETIEDIKELKRTLKRFTKQNKGKLDNIEKEIIPIKEKIKTKIKEEQNITAVLNDKEILEEVDKKQSLIREKNKILSHIKVVKSNIKNRLNYDKEILEEAGKEEKVVILAREKVKVSIPEDNYKKALELDKNEYNGRYKTHLDIMYKNQFICDVKLQKAGRETLQYAFLPKRIRNSLFPNRIEFDINNAMSIILSDMYNIHTDSLFQYSPQYFYKVKDSSNLKFKREEIGKVFDLNTIEWGKTKPQIEFFNKLKEGQRKVNLKEVGKMIAAALTGGKKITYARHITDKMNDIFNINVGELSDKESRWIHSITNRLMRQNGFNRFDEVKNTKKIARGLHKILKYSPTLLYQRIESFIIKDVERKIKECYELDNVSLLKIYDGIDVVGDINSTDEEVISFMNFVEDELTNSYYSFIQQYIKEKGLLSKNYIISNITLSVDKYINGEKVFSKSNYTREQLEKRIEGLLKVQKRRNREFAQYSNIKRNSKNDNVVAYYIQGKKLIKKEYIKRTDYINAINKEIF